MLAIQLPIGARNVRDRVGSTQGGPLVKQETRKALNLTAEHAARALHSLIADGKLAIRDVTTALSRRKRLVKELRDRFTALETGGVAAAAKARKAASPKAAGSRSRKATARKANRTRREIPAAARARAGARTTAKAAAAATTKKKMSARSSGRKASTQRAAAKAAVSRKPAHTAAAAAGTEPKQRPGADTESATPTSVPAPSAGGRRLPKVANPEHDGRGPAPQDWNRA